MENHFELFGLKPSYALAADELERAYREIQARIHPDRFAHAGAAERRASMQWTTRVNEAYRTLRSPVQRAKYLLELHGVDVAFETNTAMPAKFLARQMELREQVEDAVASRNARSLERIHEGLAREKEELHARIGERIDAQKDYLGAAALVRELMFLDKLDAEIGAASETME
jgi:molecular chaperone HscB